MVDIMMNEIDCEKTIALIKKSIRHIFKGKFPIKILLHLKRLKILKNKTTV